MNRGGTPFNGPHFYDGASEKVLVGAYYTRPQLDTTILCSTETPEIVRIPDLYETEKSRGVLCPARQGIPFMSGMAPSGCSRRLYR